MKRSPEKVMTMSGTEVPVMQSLLRAKVTPTGVRLIRRRGPRYCDEAGIAAGGSACRCLRWKRGTPPSGYKSVAEQCQAQGLSMNLKKMQPKKKR